MPLYEYRCRKCDRTFEVIQKFDDPPVRRCRRNGCSGTVEKLISVSAFHLKGGGWYADGYSKKKKEKKESSTRDSPASSSSPAASSSSSKPGDGSSSKKTSGASKD